MASNLQEHMATKLDFMLSTKQILQLCQPPCAALLVWYHFQWSMYKHKLHSPHLRHQATPACSGRHQLKMLSHALCTYDTITILFTAGRARRGRHVTGRPPQTALQPCCHSGKHAISQPPGCRAFMYLFSFA